MGNFSNLALTDSGRILFSDVQAGAVLIPTKIVLGSGNIPTGKTPATMTAVVTPVTELTVTKQNRTPDGKAVFGGVYSNKDISAAFYFRELALFARAEYRDSSGNVTGQLDEVLFVYGNAASSADLMPAYGTNTVVEKQIDIAVYIGNDAAAELSIESGVYVTQEQLAEAISDLNISDATTGKKYKWGIDNGIAYLEEVG